MPGSDVVPGGHATAPFGGIFTHIDMVPDDAVHIPLPAAPAGPPGQFAVALCHLVISENHGSGEAAFGFLYM